MGDRDQDEGDPVQGETKVGTLTILSAGLRNRLQASPAKELDKKLQEDGVTRGDRSALEILADHKVIWQELTATGAVAVGGG